MLVTNQNRSLAEDLVARGFHDLPFETYCTAPGMNSHSLMNINVSPNFYHYRRENPESSEALDFGTMAHCAFLESERFAQSYQMSELVIPKNCLKGAKEMQEVLGKHGLKKTGTKDDMMKRIHEAGLDFVSYDDLYRDHCEGKIPVSDKDRDAINRVYKSVYENEYMKKFLEKGQKEKTAFFIHPEFNVLCKIRPDLFFVENNMHVLVDLKTTRHTDLESLKRDFSQHLYRMQAAFYMDAYRIITGHAVDVSLWWTIESVPPHDWRLLQVSQNNYMSGQALYRAAMNTYLECESKQSWPGHPKFPIEVEMSKWDMQREGMILS